MWIVIFAATDWVVATNGMTTTEYVKFTCDLGTTITFPNPISSEPPHTYVFNQAGKWTSTSVIAWNAIEDFNVYRNNLFTIYQ